jgi:hypothetical protein
MVRRRRQRQSRGAAPSRCISTAAAPRQALAARPSRRTGPPWRRCTPAPDGGIGHVRVGKAGGPGLGRVSVGGARARLGGQAGVRDRVARPGRLELLGGTWPPAGCGSPRPLAACACGPGRRASEGSLPAASATRRLPAARSDGKGRRNLAARRGAGSGRSLREVGGTRHRRAGVNDSDSERPPLRWLSESIGHSSSVYSASESVVSGRVSLR